MVWVVVWLGLPGTHPASPYLLYPLSSPLYPLLTLLTTHWWAVWLRSWSVACLYWTRDSETRRRDLSRLAEFQTPTIFDRDFEFHHSIFYRALKIVKIIIYTLL